jgi:DNA mismatch repair protein MutL
MGRIRVLSENLINKIAAGEVVERPASVVKELLENALDAGAAEVRVEIENGGRSCIIVEDDGGGMDGDDILMALERHATSKLLSEKDLFAVATLGFRGEALPSIASVCRLSLSSRCAGASEGRRVAVNGGRYGPLEPCGLFEGTRVEVRDIFYNVPARRKFLRAPATELTHVLATVEHYALARPDVAFRVMSDGRELLRVAPAKDRAQRFFELFPDLPREDFFPVEWASEFAAVRGLASKPDRNFGSPRYQFTLVNGRFVRDRLLQHSLALAYENTHPKGRYPAVLLSVAIPFEKVDVNVHPTKREVRFADSQRVHDAVAVAVRRAIAPGSPLPVPQPARVSESSASFSVSSSDLFSPAPRLPDSPALFSLLPGLSGSWAPGLHSSFHSSPLRALGQWRSSFILCDSPEGLAIVDQHVAHERIRFEQFRRFLESSGPLQAFIVPQSFSLPKAVAHRAEELAELLSAQGFEADALEGAVAVRSAPAFLGSGETESLLTEFFESAAEILKTPREHWKKVLVMRSCRGSVMMHDPLGPEKMQYLLDTLFSLGAPLTCPHGRPIVFTLKEAEILSKFGRK